MSQRAPGPGETDPMSPFPGQVSAADRYVAQMEKLRVVNPNAYYQQVQALYTRLHPGTDPNQYFQDPARAYAQSLESMRTQNPGEYARLLRGGYIQTYYDKSGPLGGGEQPKSQRPGPQQPPPRSGPFDPNGPWPGGSDPTFRWPRPQPEQPEIDYFHGGGYDPLKSGGDIYEKMRELQRQPQTAQPFGDYLGTTRRTPNYGQMQSNTPTWGRQRRTGW